MSTLTPCSMACGAPAAWTVSYSDPNLTPANVCAPEILDYLCENLDALQRYHASMTVAPING